MKRSRMALFQSVITLLLCCSMLIGTTFAWFTDSVTSGNNTIASGMLDIELEYRDANGEWNKVDKRTEVLDKEALWEPGYTEVAYLRITNAGNLALKYALGVGVISETGSINAAGQEFYLSDHIRFGVVESETEPTYATREEARGALTASSLIKDGHVSTADALNKNGDTRYVTLVVYMPEDVGNAANYATGVTPPEINLGIELVATQANYESDSFGSDYDTAATLAAFNFPATRIACSTSAGVESDQNNNSSSDVTLTDEQASAEIPAGVKLDAGTSVLTLEVTTMDSSDANITLEANEAIRSLDVHVKGIAKDNDVPMAITIKEAAPKGLNMGNYKFYHVENGQTVEMTYVESNADFTAHNQFKYDPATGDIILYMATFSEVALVANTVNAWEGNFDYTWYDASKTELTIANADQLAGFGTIVGGMNDQTQDSFARKTVKLVADVNLGDKESENNPDLIFYPIGYYNSTGSYEKTSGGSVTSSVSSFEGTFDGQGHTVANFYQNTWEMFGDYNDGYSGTPNHYKDAMGLFGYVLNGTVKNLTVSNFSSDGEYTPTGVIAAYADGNSTFENIAITNCNPRVYNTGNGGIIGIAGDTSAANDDHITLKNITVDNSNKISALWGSYDVACGGLVGMYRGNVDGNGNPTGDTISFTNCHVSAQIDVYNDVCANYQYYAYRYAGMIIGSVRHNTTNAEGKTIPNMTGISATGCTVNYGDWNDYYYCEFEKNTMASYSEDYQFSRVPHSELNFTDSNGNGVVDADERASVTGCNHDHTAEENHQAVYLPFHQLFTGYSWGVSSIGLEKYSGVVTNLDITEGDQQESVVKFETKFTGDFLYRVGNQNAVSVGSLFAAIDKDKINGSGVVVTIDKVDENSNVSGTFTANTTDWTKGTIQFSGTGVVKVTIQDYNFCTPTVLMLEVISATNVAEGDKIGNYNTTSVLLGDTTVSTLYLNGGATLYGNGFTIDCTDSPINGSGSVSENYIIELVNAHLDNVKVVGKVYTEYGAMASSNYNRALVVSKGNSTITNCYLSNTASPIRLVEGNLYVKGTTVKGGNFANIDVRNGHLTVENVTTINEAKSNDKAENGATVIGLGIVVYYENVDTALTSVTIKGDLKQHNLISSNDEFSHEYATQLVNQMMSSSYKDFQYDIDGVTWVNPGYVAMTKVVPEDKREDNDGYIGQDVRFAAQDGYVYAVKPTTVNEDDNVGDGITTPGQGVIAPEYRFDYTTKNYIAKTDDSNDYCYYEGGKVLISMDQGDTFNWDPFILTAIKNGKALAYTVTYNDKTYQAGEKIAFNASGDYEINYTYVDEDNYAYNADGQLVKKPETYNQTVNISVSVIKPTTQHATFTFADTNTATEKITVNDKTYISATGVSATDKEWGYITVNGTKIFYPITEAQMKTSSKLFGGKETQVYYYVFKDAVSIVDYKDGGTGGEQLYDDSTVKMPDNLTVVNGMEAKYTAISSACVDISKLTKKGADGEVWDFSASTTVSATTTYNNYLAHQSPSGLSVKNGTRDYDAITVAQFSYIDAAGATYYYFVGYFMPNQNNSDDSGSSGGSCLAAGSVIAMADGSKKAVEDIRKGDVVMAFDHATGEVVYKNVLIVGKTYADNYYKNVFVFDDGTELAAINEHGIYDLDLRMYVNIDHLNYRDYLGHRFASIDSQGNIGVKRLVDVVSTRESGYKYDIVTDEVLNYVVEDTLSVSHEIVIIMNSFQFGDDMVYDAEAMQKDIVKYGLYTYEDFAAYCEREVFEQYNMAMMKVGVGKGLYTYEHLVYLLTEIALNENVQIN